MGRGRMAAAVAALACLASQAAAQGGARARDDAFKMVDAYIVSNLQESVGISDDQFARILPLVKRLQNDRRDLAQRRGRALAEMRRALESGTATEARVLDLLKDVKAVESTQHETIRRDMEAIDQVLTPVQQAKFRLLEGEVERKIRALMDDLRGGGRAPLRNRRNPLP
jgi:Spy/CpxP family protein refolding chaperone